MLTITGKSQVKANTFAFEDLLFQQPLLQCQITPTPHPFTLYPPYEQPTSVIA